MQGTPTCSCGALKNCKCDLLKKIQALESRNHLIQFLMGLNSGYEVVRNQILSMDPLPNVNKAYYIVQLVEKQKQMSEIMNVSSVVEGGAYAVQRQPSKFSNIGGGGRKEYRKNKQDRFCDHCKMRGHTMDQCFKLHGYPDWCKDERFKTGISGAPKFATQAISEIQVADNPLKTEAGSSVSGGIDLTLMNTICQEVVKALQGKHVATNLATTFTSSSEIGHFAGNVHSSPPLCSYFCANVNGITSQ